MIRVNLLPQEIERKAIAQRRMLLAIALGVMVVVAFLGVYLLRVAKITSLKSELKQVNIELKKYDADLKKVKHFESEKVRLTNQLNTINQLVEARLDWPKLMEVMTLKNVLPSGVKLNNLSTTGSVDEIRLQFNIEAFDNYAVADLLTNLDKSPLFKNVKVSGFSSGGSSEGTQTVPRMMAVGCVYLPERSKKK